ncbi:carboxymuconolactone decarboxylase family protein [Ruicaihuangia caeni]|uniref:Carboxymuconolactone decarboxylase family protein n=1 Tax=Ruicaihuangia caeni TaxID=3042517 RepID=A0AAW6TAZ7_9MICO|nr:carboxymuconolactone decarboxylase family protein [Klugiella sp. YN-L-19]MDI2099003.1 carboxymuconolactone decarboxylase family protein [Klugiella sp. YN-L-19]
MSNERTEEGAAMPTPEQQEQIDQYLETYRDLMGFVPPRVAARFERLSRSNPELLIAQEKVRNLVAYDDVLDEKTTQLILTAVLAVQLRDAAALHGHAARRAGASWEELQATFDLAYLFGGVSVANHTPAFLDKIADFESKAAEESR